MLITYNFCDETVKYFESTFYPNFVFTCRVFAINTFKLFKSLLYKMFQPSNGSTSNTNKIGCYLVYGSPS